MIAEQKAYKKIEFISPFDNHIFFNFYTTGSNFMLKFTESELSKYNLSTSRVIKLKENQVYNKMSTSVECQKFVIDGIVFKLDDLIQNEEISNYLRRPMKIKTIRYYNKNVLIFLKELNTDDIKRLLA
jgi:NAD-dependent DNA ligase